MRRIFKSLGGLPLTGERVEFVGGRRIAAFELVGSFGLIEFLRGISTGEDISEENLGESTICPSPIFDVPEVDGRNPYKSMLRSLSSDFVTED